MLDFANHGLDLLQQTQLNIDRLDDYDIPEMRRTIHSREYLKMKNQQHDISIEPTSKEYKKFLEKKDELIASLTLNIEESLRDMGDDVKKLSWFPSNLHKEITDVNFLHAHLEISEKTIGLAKSKLKRGDVDGAIHILNKGTSEITALIEKHKPFGLAFD